MCTSQVQGRVNPKTTGRTKKQKHLCLDPVKSNQGAGMGLGSREVQWCWGVGLKANCATDWGERAQ